MGNMLYQASDNMNTVKGDKTAKYSNAATNLSLRNSPDLSKNLLNFTDKLSCYMILYKPTSVDTLHSNLTLISLSQSYQTFFFVKQRFFPFFIVKLECL